MTTTTDNHQLQPEPTELLLSMLNLEDLAPNGHDDALYSAESLTQETPRIFGGQVLAQSIIAASRTVEESRSLHSLHGYFLRPGAVADPLTYGVQKLNDARSFSARRVHGYQHEEPIFSCIMSFQEPARGVEHSATMPSDIPEPESLPTAADLIGKVPHPMAQAVAFTRPFDIRHITPALYTQADQNHRATNMVWLKTTSALPDNPVVHQAALAYASDYTVMEPILRAHGKFWLQPGIKFASLDHSMWFHRQARADEWLLYVQESPTAQDARGLSTGRLFTRDGVHVATVTQEAMLRFPEFK